MNSATATDADFRASTFERIQLEARTLPQQSASTSEHPTLKDYNSKKACYSHTRSAFPQTDDDDFRASSLDCFSFLFLIPCFVIHRHYDQPSTRPTLPMDDNVCNSSGKNIITTTTFGNCVLQEVEAIDTMPKQIETCHGKIVPQVQQLTMDSSPKNIMTTTTFGDCLLQEVEAIDTMPHGKLVPDAPNVGEELNIEPCVGMEFESIERVKEFYNSFAKKQGFRVPIGSTKPKRAILVCCNEGQHRVKDSINEDIKDGTNETKRKCSTFRSGCEASLVVARGTTESNWIIQSFNNHHNHVMVSPKSVSYMRCHKRMSVAAKSLVEKFKEEGILTGKVATIFNNGDLAFSNRDCWNPVISNNKNCTKRSGHGHFSGNW